MSRILSFLVGTYVGLFTAQNIEVPKVPGPVSYVEKVKEYFKGEPENKDKGKGK